MPERSPDSGIMSEKISQSLDGVLSPSTSAETNADQESSPPQTEKPGPENRPISTKSDIVSEKGEDFDVGQVVWVWLASYPLWPGMIAPAPELDPDHGKSVQKLAPVENHHFQENISSKMHPIKSAQPNFTASFLGQLKKDHGSVQKQ